MTPWVRRLESVRRETGQSNCVWSRVVCAPKNRGSHNVRARKKIDPWTDLVGVYQPALDRCPDRRSKGVLLRVRQTVGRVYVCRFFSASCDPPPDTFFFPGSERRMFPHQPASAIDTAHPRAGCIPLSSGEDCFILVCLPSTRAARTLGTDTDHEVQQVRCAPPYGSKGPGLTYPSKKTCTWASSLLVNQQ